MQRSKTAGPGLGELRLVRVSRAASFPVVRGYESYVLGTGAGLDVRAEELRFRVA